MSNPKSLPQSHSAYPAGQLQPSSNNEAALAVSANLDPALKGLPVEVVGQEDPLNIDRTKGFPHVLYHGTKDADFQLDDSRNHRNSWVGTGARSGAGLYAGSEGVSKTFGSGEVVELVPHEAKLIDLDAPEASEPLSNEFKTAYLEDYRSGAAQRVQGLFPDVPASVIADLWKKFDASEGLILKGAVHIMAGDLVAAGVGGFGPSKLLAREVASQINTARVVEGLSDASLRDLFAGYDEINGKSRLGDDVMFDIAPTIDFLTSRGIDGAKTVQKFDSDQGQEPGVVLWKLDNVGDKRTWEERAVDTPKRLADIVLKDDGIELKGEANLTSLDKSYTISRERAEAIAMIVNNKEALVPKPQMDTVVSLIAEGNSTPLELVKALADSSPELAELLSATTGTLEGQRLHEHTQAVLGQFEKHYADAINDPKERQLIRTALLLQDIGKSLAVARTGAKTAQTGYNRTVARNLLDQVDSNLMTDDEKILVRKLIGQDIIGERLKDETTLEGAEDALDDLLDSLPESVDVKQVERMMQVMYMSDASAYTSEASYTKANGDVQSSTSNLDRLFSRNQNGRLTLSEPYHSTARAIFEDDSAQPARSEDSTIREKKIDKLVEERASHLENVQTVLDQQGIDIDTANDRFAAQTQTFIDDLSQTALREGRDLTDPEKMQIQQLEAAIADQRVLADDLRFRDFEARAPQLVQRIRARAQTESRPLNTDEIEKIRNISRAITSHRARRRTRIAQKVQA